MGSSADLVARRRLRATAQLLHRPPGLTAAGVVTHLLAVQAQDAQAAALSIRARAPDAPHVASADGLVVTWLMRSTLHLVRAEDVGWLHALCAPRQRAASRRRWAQLGIDEARAEAVGRTLAEAQPASRPAAGELLGEQGPLLSHLLHRAAIDGWIVLGADRRVLDGRALLADAPDRDRALAELGRRWRPGRPDGGPEDLARWSGLPLGDARRALAEARAPAPAPERTGVRLLGAFDELLLGWRDRSCTVPAALERVVHPGGGVLRASVIDDGEVVGTWSLRGGRVTTDARGAEEESQAVARFVAGAGNGGLRT